MTMHMTNKSANKTSNLHPWGDVAVSKHIQYECAGSDKLLILEGDSGYENSPESPHIEIGVRTRYGKDAFSIPVGAVEDLITALHFFMSVHYAYVKQNDDHVKQKTQE